MTNRLGRAGDICDALRLAILEQALQPGAKLPEDALGERFGVSRTIARHALGQLAAEGLVDLERNRGATVAKPSWEDARDLFDVRSALERTVVARLSGRLTETQIGVLKAHVGKEQAARGRSDPVAIRLATEFHLLLADMTDSPVLVRYVRELCLRCGLTLALHGRPHSRECAVSEHLAVIEALVDGDVEAAMGCMSGHLDAVAHRALVEPAGRSGSVPVEILATYAGGNET